MDCEVLLAPDMALRGLKILQAMIDAAPAAGVRCFVTKTHEKRAKVLMAYGLGHPLRRNSTRSHVARGGRLLGWDLGYWGRDVSGRAAMRLTLDQDHPQQHITDMPAGRWEAAGIALRSDGDPSGPIVLCGMGQKAREVLTGTRGNTWELQTLAAIRAAHPGRRVLYRPKREQEGSLPGCLQARGSIEDAVRGASLVVCRHSNVAVDACIAGVPVVCWDGASAALYGSDLRNPRAPGVDERRRFLQNLAWWQWNPTEALQAWSFIRERLCA